MATPNWSAARAGLLGDNGAVDASAQVNQFLGTHASSDVYQGNAILTPNGSGGTAWAYELSDQDLSQPFTMSGTTIGRVVVPLLAVGEGTDLILSLYSNSSGVPGSVITQTRIPASWITQASAVTSVSVPSSETPITQYTGSPLATAAFNGLHLGPLTTVNWPLPAVQATGSLVYPGAATVGDLIVLVGGTNIVGGTTLFNNVFTIAGDASGNLAQAVPQPAFPTVVANPALVGVTDPASGAVTVAAVSGQTTHGADPVANVYTASLDAATGVVSAWTAQSVYPTGVLFPGIASYNGFLYVIGGQTTVAGATTSAVYYAQVVNGQITAWTATTPLPVATAQTTSVQATAIDGLVLVDFYDTGFVRRTVYAPIGSDGSLGSWQAMATVPDNTTLNAFDYVVNTDTYGVIYDCSDKIVAMGFTANGPAPVWQTANVNTGSPYLNGSWRLLVGGEGSWQYYVGGIGTTGTPGSYMTGTLSLTPMISVPLPTTGLTNGATYHVVLSQPNGDLNNYLRTHDDFDVFPGNPTVLTRATGSTSWSAGTSGHAVPLMIYDNSNGTGTLGARNNQVVHTWGDNGARISTLVYTSTPERRLIGVLDATVQPGPVLNANFDFNNGVNFWNANNGTLAASSTFTQGGLPFSGKFTPNGVSGQTYIESQLQAVNLQQSYTGTCWFYSPTGYSNCEIIINWYTAAGFSGGFISSSTGATTSVAANTWTQLTVTGTPPVTAVYATVGVYERGTPPASAVFYASAVTLQAAPGPQVSSVAQINYTGTWPGAGLLPPTGVTVLA